jgi:hypothetical protein
MTTVTHFLALRDRRCALIPAMLIVADAQWACDNDEGFDLLERVLRSLEKSWEDTLE